jgi:hypothetical protein
VLPLRPALGAYGFNTRFYDAIINHPQVLCAD